LPGLGLLVAAGLDRLLIPGSFYPAASTGHGYPAIAALNKFVPDSGHGPDQPRPKSIIKLIQINALGESGRLIPRRCCNATKTLDFARPNLENSNCCGAPFNVTDRQSSTKLPLLFVFLFFVLTPGPA
jgi:hypothetical protein